MSYPTLDEPLDKKPTDFSHIRHVSFLDRFCANLIDSFVMMLLMSLTFFCLMHPWLRVFAILGLALEIIYKPFMEYRYGATIGKMRLDLKVVNTAYQPISLKQSILRSLPWSLPYMLTLFSFFFMLVTSGLEIASFTMISMKYTSGFGIFGLKKITSWIFLISVLYILVDVKKQGLHDKLAGTYCVHKY